MITQPAESTGGSGGITVTKDGPEDFAYGDPARVVTHPAVALGEWVDMQATCFITGQIHSIQMGDSSHLWELENLAEGLGADWVRVGGTDYDWTGNTSVAIPGMVAGSYIRIDSPYWGPAHWYQVKTWPADPTAPPGSVVLDGYGQPLNTSNVAMSHLSADGTTGLFKNGVSGAVFSYGICRSLLTAVDIELVAAIDYLQGTLWGTYTENDVKGALSPDGGATWYVCNASGEWVELQNGLADLQTGGMEIGRDAEAPDRWCRTNGVALSADDYAALLALLVNTGPDADLCAVIGMSNEPGTGVGVMYPVLSWSEQGYYRPLMVGKYSGYGSGASADLVAKRISTTEVEFTVETYGGDYTNCILFVLTP